jgi:hypothetical protein
MRRTRFGPGTVGPSLYNSDSDLGNNTAAWTNPGNALADDGVYAVMSCSAASTPNTLQFTDPLYSAVPSNATINGIEVTLRGHASNNPFNVGGPTEMFDSVSVQLRKAGGSAGLGQGDLWTTTDTTYTQGGPTDLWNGSPWTPSDVNNSGFQLDLSASIVDELHTNHPTHSISLDWVKIKIYFTTP